MILFMRSRPAFTRFAQLIGRLHSLGNEHVLQEL